MAENQATPQESNSVSGENFTQNTQLVEEVFSMFKDYLASQLEVKDKHIEEKSKISKDASELKFKGNRRQFELNAGLSNIFKSIEENIDNPSEIRQLIEEGQQLIKNRQKLIKLADRSKDGWQVAQEYESDDLASNSEDEKRIRKAESAVEKKRKEGKSQANNAPKRFEPCSDNHLFRGKAVRVLCQSHVVLCEQPTIYCCPVYLL